MKHYMLTILLFTACDWSPCPPYGEDPDTAGPACGGPTEVGDTGNQNASPEDMCQQIIGVPCILVDSWVSHVGGRTFTGWDVQPTDRQVTWVPPPIGVYDWMFDDVWTDGWTMMVAKSAAAQVSGMKWEGATDLPEDVLLYQVVFGHPGCNVEWYPDQGAGGVDEIPSVEHPVGANLSAYVAPLPIFNEYQNGIDPEWPTNHRVDPNGCALLGWQRSGSTSGWSPLPYVIDDAVMDYAEPVDYAETWWVPAGGVIAVQGGA